MKEKNGIKIICYSKNKKIKEITEDIDNMLPKKLLNKKNYSYYLIKSIKNMDFKMVFKLIII